GHNAAILVQEDGSVSRLSRGGTIVGAFEGAAYEEAGAVLGRGGIVVVFSDGISEASNAAGDEFGEDRIASLAVASRGLSAEQIRDGLFAAVDSWSEGLERNDDQTLVVLKASGAR
ncbi:MAG TPA: SpoIIE family protein phosphatase, partial [Verrucomicrobiae bacterium]|nr:SpoIIE family protein phosphatase [Verrucomicrobiae bacterium]